MALICSTKPAHITNIIYTGWSFFKCLFAMMCHKSFCILVFVCTHQRLPLSCSVVPALPLRTPATFALQSIYNMIGKGNTNKKYNHLQPNEPRTCFYFADIFFIFIEQQWLLFCDWHPYHAVHYRTTCWHVLRQLHRMWCPIIIVHFSRPHHLSHYVRDTRIRGLFCSRLANPLISRD